MTAQKTPDSPPEGPVIPSRKASQPGATVGEPGAGGVAGLPFLKTSDAMYRKIGLLIVFITFGVFGGWAAFAPLESAALAQGVVMVKGSRKSLQHLEGGIVREILVREGQLVGAGDPLIVLDDTQFRSELEVLRGQFYTIKTLEARLQAERDGITEIAFPQVLTDIDDPRLDEAIAGQKQVFRARLEAREGETEVLKQRYEQLQSQIEGIEAVRESNADLLSSYASEISELRKLLAQGFTGKQRLTELERDRAKLTGENAEALASIASNKIRMGETQLQIIQLDRYELTEVVDELGGVQSELFNITERLRAVEDKVARTVIKAPVGGIVLGLNIHTVGGVVRPATTLLDLVPDSQQLVVDAEVSPMDIDRVREGVKAKIRFSAFKSATTPIAEGVVVSISADRLLREKNGEPYYLAQIDVSEESLARMPKGFTLLPGMPAEVLINTGSRTLLQYVLQPASNAMARALIED